MKQVKVNPGKTMDDLFHCAELSHECSILRQNRQNKFPSSMLTTCKPHITCPECKLHLRELWGREPYFDDEHPENPPHDGDIYTGSSNAWITFTPTTPREDK